MDNAKKLNAFLNEKCINLTEFSVKYGVSAQWIRQLRNNREVFSVEVIDKLNKGIEEHSRCNFYILKK